MVGQTSVALFVDKVSCCWLHDRSTAHAGAAKAPRNMDRVITNRHESSIKSVYVNVTKAYDSIHHEYMIDLLVKLLTGEQPTDARRRRKATFLREIILLTWSTSNSIAPTNSGENSKYFSVRQCRLLNSEFTFKALPNKSQCGRCKEKKGNIKQISTGCCALLHAACVTRHNEACNSDWPKDMN